MNTLQLHYKYIINTLQVHYKYIINTYANTERNIDANLPSGHCFTTEQFTDAMCRHQYIAWQSSKPPIHQIEMPKTSTMCKTLQQTKL